MKYLVIEIQKFDTGAISTPTYAYDDRNAAEAKYHAILASAAGSALPSHACTMLTEDGRLVRNEVYKHEPVVEEEPTPEEEVTPDDTQA